MSYVLFQTKIGLMSYAHKFDHMYVVYVHVYLAGSLMEVKNSKPSAANFQPLVDISLDSVLQKSNELARILLTCKHTLENQPSPGNWGRASLTLLRR